MAPTVLLFELREMSPDVSAFALLAAPTVEMPDQDRRPRIAAGAVVGI
ncbi:hypothetical protein [Streptomyces sp. NPDC093225]